MLGSPADAAAAAVIDRNLHRVEEQLFDRIYRRLGGLFSGLRGPAIVERFVDGVDCDGADIPTGARLPIASIQVHAALCAVQGQLDAALGNLLLPSPAAAAAPRTLPPAFERLVGAAGLQAVAALRGVGGAAAGVELGAVVMCDGTMSFPPSTLGEGSPYELYPADYTGPTSPTQLAHHYWMPELLVIRSDAVSAPWHPAAAAVVASWDPAALAAAATASAAALRLPLEPAALAAAQARLGVMAAAAAHALRGGGESVWEAAVAAAPIWRRDFALAERILGPEVAAMKAELADLARRA